MHRNNPQGVNTGNPFMGAAHIDRYLGSSFDIVYEVYKRLDSIVKIHTSIDTLLPFGEIVEDLKKGVSSAGKRKLDIETSGNGTGNHESVLYDKITVESVGGVHKLTHSFAPTSRADELLTGLKEAIREFNESVPENGVVEDAKIELILQRSDLNIPLWLIRVTDLGAELTRLSRVILHVSEGSSEFAKKPDLEFTWSKSTSSILLLGASQDFIATGISRTKDAQNAAEAAELSAANAELSNTESASFAEEARVSAATAKSEVAEGIISGVEDVTEYATEQAERAEQAEQQAQGAAVRAESAAVAAYTSGNLFNDTSSGIAATESGQYFLLKTANPQSFSVYINNGGTPVLQPDQFKVSTESDINSASLGVVGMDGRIVVDMVGRQIIVSATAFIFHKGRHINVPVQTVSFTTPNLGYVKTLHVNPDTGAAGLAESGSLPIGSIPFAYLYDQHLLALDDFGVITVKKDTTTPSFFGSLRGLELLLAGQISINRKTALVTNTGVDGRVTTKRGIITIPRNQSVPITAPITNEPMFLTADIANGALSFIATYPPTNWPVLAVVYQQRLYKPVGSRITYYTEGGSEVFAEGSANALSNSAALSANASLSINLQNRTAILNIPNYDVIALSNGKYKAIPVGNQEVEFESPYPNGVIYFFVTEDTGALNVVTAPAVPPAGSFLLATTYDGVLYAPYDSHARISAIGATGDIIPNPNTVKLPPFDPAEMRGVFPRKLYFVAGKPLRVYKKPCFTTSEQNTDAVDFWVDTGSSSVADRFLQANDTVVLDPSSLGTKLSFNYKSKTVSNTRYIGTTDVHVAPEGAVDGSSINLLMFGDSLTEGGMTAALSSALQARGATVTPVGTYISSANGNNRGEGRGFWNYRSFIGKDNYSTGVGPHTRSAGGKTNTSKFENPFLKLASAQDKVDHPDWCFRFTGADRELSYAEDTDKTGDFYLFDFAWYRSEHSVPAPDVITIALSTNDINLDRASYTQEERLQFMRLGLEVMVRQIRANLPTTPIGIIPAPAWSSTDTGDGRWMTETASWIDQCMTDVETLNAELGNISVIPVWPFMSEDWAFLYASSAPLNPTSSVQVKQITDWVHFDPVGIEQYVSVLEAWAACTI